MTSVIRRVVALAAILATVACTKDSPPTAAWTGTIDTLPSGAVVVHNPAGGIWDSAAGWRIVEAARIGTDDGEGPASFSQINAIEVDAGGRIYVLEGETQDIRVFDSAGSWIRTLGRKGAGPGEFQQAAGMVWDTAGRLWVVDQSQARYTVFDTSGVLVTTLPRASTTSSIFPWPGILTSDGKLIEWQSPGFDSSPRLIRLDVASLAALDTAELPAFMPEYFELVRTSGGNVSRTRASVPFSPQLVWRLAPDGTLWFGISDQYRVIQRSLAGDTLRVIERAFTPVPVSDAARDSIVQRLEWFVKQGGELDKSRIPRLRPAFASFILDDEGQLWVRASGESASPHPGFDVFDSVGRHLGVVRLPFRLGFNDPLIRKGQVYAVTVDSLDVPYVVRAVLRRDGGTAGRR